MRLATPYHVVRRWKPAVAGFVASILFAIPLAAQTGSVTGVIVDKSGRQPINGVQVSVDGTTRGMLTDQRGRFNLINLPAGQVVLRATYIGYRTELQTVTITVGAPVVANFELGVSAISLDEVVVTGTAGAVEKKQLGATISTVSVANVQERVPVADIGSVLQARIPGVRSIGTVGGVGASKDLRIRGTSSFSLGQRPVVYVDGVKIDTRQTVWNGMGTQCCSFSGGAGVDRLNDLNPNDIERIEVIKGAAAGTLYGTEATNGVIQIFTKKGRSESAPRWSTQVTTGAQRYRANLQTKEFPRFVGLDGTRALDANKSLLENGPYLGADMTVQGGGTTATYFVSGGYTDEKGSIQPNYMKRGNLRMNMHWLAGQKLSFDVNSAYTRNRISELQSGNNWTSLMGNAVLGVPYNACVSTGCADGIDRPYGEPWVPIAAIKKIDTFNDVSRWTGGVTMNFNVRDNFTHKFQVGLDQVSEEMSMLRPFGFPYTYVPAGEKSVGYRNFRSVTADYLGSLTFDDILEGLNTRISFGAQGFQESERFNNAVGNTYAAPGVTTVNGGSIRAGDERYREVVQIGFFGQNRFAFRDRVFLTTGVRFDGNSAFGTNYGFQMYPNVQLSYDLSNVGWMPTDKISNLRLRAAVGTAGLAPGAFDKFLTYTPLTTGEETSGVRASTGGNQDLGPERTTEYEGGFEIGFFNDRIGIDATVYRRDTKDAISSIAVAPSMSYGSSPRINIGGLRDQGYEVTLRATPIEHSRIRWQADLRVDGNHNEVTDLGMEADTVVQRRGGLRLGYPVRTVFNRVLCTEYWSKRQGLDSGGCTGKTAYNPTTRLFTRSDTTVYLGKTLPDLNISLGNEVSFGAFRLYGNVTAERGATFGNSDRPYRANNRSGDEYLSKLANAGDALCVTSWPTGAQGARYVDTGRKYCDTAQSDSIYNLWRAVSPTDSRASIRIRELSLGYQVPESLSAKLGVSRTIVTFAAQNLQWWDNCHCMDPNMTYLGGADFGETSGFLAQPQPRMFKLSLRTTF